MNAGGSGHQLVATRIVPGLAAMGRRLRETRMPTWLLAGLLAMLTWRLGMDAPSAGLDKSWNAGLAMAAKEQLHFGTEIVFTYGPLGFLRGQSLWYDDLAVIAFCYSAALYLAFCTSLIWALRRVFPAGAAFAIAFFAVVQLSDPQQSIPILLPALVCLGMLARERSVIAVNALVIGGASFSAVELLVKLSTGPVILALFLITLVGLRARWWQLLGFVSLLAVALVLLWMIAGQAASNVPEFIGNGWEITSGYSEAMVALTTSSPTAVAIVAAAVLAALVAASAKVPYLDGRARWSAVLLMAVAGFLIFKEGVVRADEDHLVSYLSTACLLWLAIPWSREQRPVLLGGAIVIAVLALHTRQALGPPAIDPLGSAKDAGSEVRNLLSPSRRAELAASGRAAMKEIYDLDRQTLGALRGRTVAIEPYEVGVAWAYRFDWSPLPVFQNYNAYTPRLDRLNADAVESPTGPERILRENQALVFPEFQALGIDNRFPGWDPPEQSRAVLCHFIPLDTTSRWQVLGRVPNRCDPPRLVRSVRAGFGVPVTVPALGHNQVVFVRIHGGGENIFWRIRALLLRPPLRHAVVNGTRTYRLVPATAPDGLMLRASGGVAGSGIFAQVPQAETIELPEINGVNGGLRFDFFRMRVRPTGDAAEGGAWRLLRRPPSDQGVRGRIALRA